MRKTGFKIASVLAISLFLAAPLIGITAPQTIDRSLFTVYVGYPDNNPARISWAEVITNSFQRVGIDARGAIGDWGVWIPRVFDPDPGEEGNTYLNDGWDIFFVGWSASVLPDPTSLYHTSGFVPTGNNYILWSDPTSDALCEGIVGTTNDTYRRELLLEWMELFMYESPKAIILYPMSPWAYDPALQGFDDQSYAYPQTGDHGFRWATDGGTFLTTINAAPEDYNALIYDSYYDACAWGPIHEALFYYNDSDDLFAYAQTPALAADHYTVSPDGLAWDFDLRTGVYWPTGWELNASDYMFSYRHICDPNSTAPLYADFQVAGLVNDDGNGLNESLVYQTGTYSIHVDFPSIYAYSKFLLNVPPMSNQALNATVTAGGFAALPSHESNTGADWTTTSGPGSPGGAGNTITVHGPLGIGPYDCIQAGTGWDATSQTFTCKLRPEMTPGTGNDPGYYFGNKGHHPSMPDMFDTHVAVVVGSADAAIAALQDGSIDLIDTQFQIQTKLDLLDPAWATPLIEIELGLQEMGFNMMHPVLGTGVDTPLGKADPSMAATAARYVRQALNHLIPREDIIDEIMDGLAEPGITFISPLLGISSPTIVPYEYNVTLAKQLLMAAGYEFPGPAAPPVLLYASWAVSAVAIVVAVIFLIQWRRK